MTARQKLSLRFGHPEPEVRAAAAALEKIAPPAMPTEMPQADVVDLIKDMIPVLHGMGQHQFVEALSGALDRLEWAHLSTAPRDGRKVIVLFDGRGDWPPYLAFAKWVVPEAGRYLNHRARELLERNGGWWTSSKAEIPHRTAAIGWLPAPELPQNLDHPEPADVA